MTNFVRVSIIPDVRLDEPVALRLARHRSYPIREASAYRHLCV